MKKAKYREETHKPVWMVWQIIEPGVPPALRAICTTEKKAKRYLEPKAHVGDGTWIIEKNMTNHLYGEADYSAVALMDKFFNSRINVHEGD